MKKLISKKNVAKIIHKHLAKNNLGYVKSDFYEVMFLILDAALMNTFY